MRLIPLAAEVAGCLAVGALAVDEQVERLVEGPLDVAERPPGCLEAPLDLGGLGREPVLLLLVRPVLRRMRSLRDLRWSKMPRPRTVRDPPGREVLLTAERWRHIVDGHPELAAHEDDVRRAVEAPTEAMAGRGLGEEWFYLHDAGPSRWLKVVVVFDRPASGRIITAFPRRRKP